MLLGLIALTFAAAFWGAALYIHVAEHPARMGLDDRNALAQWAPSYARAFTMQGGLAVASGIAGLCAGWLTGQWSWAVGAGLMLANWPYTVFGILPLNNRLKAVSPEAANSETRAMLERWNRLHRLRTILSGLAIVAYLWAASG